MSDYTPIEITQAEADAIIDEFDKQGKSLTRPGRFYLKDGDLWVGIDNRDGDAWTEDFPTKRRMLNWLLDITDSEGNRYPKEVAQ